MRSSIPSFLASAIVSVAVNWLVVLLKSAALISQTSSVWCLEAVPVLK